MSIPSPSIRVFDSAVAAWLEPIVRRFEEAWQRGERPDIDTFLPVEADGRPIARIELIHLELELRLKAGEAARVEEYRNRYPELAEDRSRILELIFLEFSFRARNDPALRIEEYRRRFPHLAAELAEAHITLPSPKHEPSLPPTIDFAHADEPTLNVVAEKPQIPGYEILEELGRGGMGVVYKAKQLALRRLVALKMILNGSFADGEERRRFLAEAQTLAKLQHPNIVQVYDVGEHRGQPFFALELIEGGTLAKRMTDKPLSVTEAAQLMATLARTVYAAHKANIVHRDLKPTNIMLTAEEIPKIGDFGLAKHLDAETMRTQSGAIMGTPAYMAPEQASGRTKMIGPSADIYALGVILYELLTGRVPFRGVTQFDVLQKVLNDEPISLRSLHPKLPRDIETICLKCLEKNPDRRYRSALELAEDLERYLTGKPIRARSVSVWERGIKWGRRHPATAGILIVIALALATLIGIWVFLTVKMRQELTRTTSELQQTSLQRQEELHRDLHDFHYVADVRQAAQFRQFGEISQCYHFLEEHRRQEEVESRGFEWRYLYGWSDVPSRLIQAHTANIRCIRFHADGTMLASCGADRSIRFWDSETGQPSGPLFDHGEHVRGIAFSSDGRTLASIGNDDTVQIWDYAARRQLPPLIEHVKYLEAIEFSPQNELLAFVSQGGGEVQLWDFRSRTTRHIWRSGADAVRSIAFTPDARSVVLGYESGRVKFYDVTSGTERIRLFEKHSAHALAFARKSPVFAVGGADGVVILQDTETYAIIHELVGHAGRICALAFSPDEQILLSASEDGTIRSWDVASGGLQGVYRGTQNRAFTSMAFRPDGRMFAAASDNGLVYLWSTNAVEKSERLLEAVVPAGPILFSPNGKWLAVAGQDHTVRLLDPVTRRVQKTLPGWHGEWNDLAFSADGKQLAAACSDRRVLIWDTSSGRRRHQLLGHRDAVTCATYSPDGTWLVSGGADHRIAVWEMPTGTLRITRDAHESPITAVAFHPKGTLLATASRDKFIKLWSVPDFQLVRQVAQDEEIIGLNFLHEGKSLLVNGESTGVSCRNFDEAQGFSAAKGFTSAARHLTVSADGRLLIVSDLTLIHGFDPLARKERFYLYPEGQGGEKQVALSPDGTTLVFNRRGGPLKWWDLKRHQIRETPEGISYPVSSLAFTRCGDTLITGSSTSGHSRIRVLRPFGMAIDCSPIVAVADGVRFSSIRASHSLPPLSAVPAMADQPLVAVSPDGRTLATGANDGSVSLWDLATGKRCAHLLVSRHSRYYLPIVERSLALGIPIRPDFDRTDQIHALAFSANNRWLAVAGGDGQVQLYDASSGKEWTTLTGEHADVSCLAFSPDGKLLATNNGNTIELWDMSASEGLPFLSRKIQGHSTTVRCLAFSTDGRLLASGEDNWDIRIWNTANGAEAKRLQGHIGRVSSLAFHPDGKTLASASWDSTVRLWHVATGHELMVLQRGVGLVHAVAFSPDGTILAAGGERTSGRGEVWFWRESLPSK